jgi:hypothetical protein
MDQVIAGQVIGSVAYIAQPIFTAVASEILPRRSRPMAQAGLNAGGGLGGITGLLAGSVITTDSLFGWRKYWYIVTALSGASAIILTILYWPPPRPLQKSLTFKEKIARLDWVAYALLAISLTLFVMGLSWGDNPFSWSNPHVLATLIVGGVFFLIFVGHQTFIKKDGLIHHDLFKKDRNFALALGCFFADGVVFFAANNYFGFEVAVLYETDTLQANLHFAITFCTGFFAAFLVYVLSKFTKNIREPIVISFLFLTAFFGTYTFMIGDHESGC